LQRTGIAERFTRGAGVLTRLNHFRVVTLYDGSIMAPKRDFARRLAGLGPHYRAQPRSRRYRRITVCI